MTASLKSGSSAEHPASSVKLDSWKEIAAYLGRDPRTVQLWEKHEGLPIHRLNHHSRASVYAYTGELEIWLQAHSPQKRWAAKLRGSSDLFSGAQGRWARGLLLGALLLAAGALLFLWIHARHAAPVRPAVSRLAVFPRRSRMEARSRLSAQVVSPSRRVVSA